MTSACRRLSARVAAVVAPRGGVIYRCGGEGILILLPGTGLADGMPLAATGRSAIEGTAIPRPALGADSVVTASPGVAGAVIGDVTLRDLAAAADTALHAASDPGETVPFPVRLPPRRVAIAVRCVDRPPAPPLPRRPTSAKAPPIPHAEPAPCLNGAFPVIG